MLVLLFRRVLAFSEPNIVRRRKIKGQRNVFSVKVPRRFHRDGSDPGATFDLAVNAFEAVGRE